ncbi:MAG: 16S rRNA (cytidine(1402)-2'-O)-methyltransferase [Proteobacteria bacterium]|nr:16S rRNA (cytidine(1402)-2'-O)-methyltransferase [Pseudomonadota bacterium]
MTSAQSRSRRKAVPAGRGRLSIVATPIGNLEDITLRALSVLRSADLILAEDTRRTRALCARHHIVRRVHSFHAYSGRRELERRVEDLRAGAHIALVSDAGTPLLSDPGADLVRAAHETGARVESLPGPSAITCALAGAGLGTDDFRFVGFLPRKGRGRRQRLEEIARADYATVLFEAPSRLGATLDELARLSPRRAAAVCRELTKIHEEFVHGTLTELAAHFAGKARGETTVVVGPAQTTREARIAEGPLQALVSDALQQGQSPRDAARWVARSAAVGRRDAYARVLAELRRRTRNSQL